VDAISESAPKVGVARQPWAGGPNPFGIVRSVGLRRLRPAALRMVRGCCGSETRAPVEDAPSVAFLLPFDLPSCDRFFEVQRQKQISKAIIFDLDSCLVAADEVGGCSHLRLRPSARPTIAVFRKISCGRRSPSAGASRSMPSTTNMVAMRIAGWHV